MRNPSRQQSGKALNVSFYFFFCFAVFGLCWHRLQETEIHSTKASNSFLKAIDVLTQGIAITSGRPVLVHGYFEASNQLSTLGTASAASFWTLSGVQSSTVEIDPNYWYPQGLAKQITNDTLPWSQWDIVAHFNPDAGEFWFDDDHGPISSFQYDFFYVWV